MLALLFLAWSRNYQHCLNPLRSVKLCDEYGSKLLKLAKENISKEEEGSLQVALDFLTKEAELEGQAMVDFSRSVRDNILKPFADFDGELLKRKRVVSFWM